MGPDVVEMQHAYAHLHRKDPPKDMCLGTQSHKPVALGETHGELRDWVVFARVLETPCSGIKVFSDRTGKTR